MGQLDFHVYRCTQDTLLNEDTVCIRLRCSACCWGDPEFALDSLPRHPSLICELSGAIVHVSLVHFILALMRHQISGWGVGTSQAPGLQGAGGALKSALMEEHGWSGEPLTAPTPRAEG